MSPTTEHLLYLGLGLLTFLSLLLGLRLIATELELKSKPSEKLTDWNGLATLVLVNIFEESHDVRSFVFKRASGSLFPPFKPGQFISFQIGKDPRFLRSYSISSSPSEVATIQVSVKRLPGGLGSQWMHSLSVGDNVLAYPPSGYFVESESSDRSKVFIAGGIGITPFVSMLLNQNTKDQSGTISLFYGMRSRKDMAFHDLLSHLTKRSSSLHYFPFLSETDENWDGGVGNISAEVIWNNVKIPEMSEFYLCGPTAMTESIIPALLDRGVSKEKIHLEKFVSPTTINRDSIPSRNLTLSWNGQKIMYQGQETILEALEKAGIQHPYACRVGVCGSCKCHATGQFIQLTDAGLSLAEKTSGFCLPCVAFPKEDLDLNLG